MVTAPAPGRRFAWSVAAAALGAAVLGVFRLGQQSLWFDELVSMRIARSSWADMWRASTGSEGHSGVYHVTSWLWVGIFGDSEAGLRSLSVVFGIATVATLMLLAKRCSTPASRS